MSNLKNIGNKLFKETTELKSQEVELGKIDDLAKASDRAKNVLKSSKGVISDFENAKKRAKKVLEDAESEIRNLQPIKTEVFRALKELGGGKLLAPSQNPVYKQASQVDKDLREILSSLSRLMR